MGDLALLFLEFMLLGIAVYFIAIGIFKLIRWLFFFIAFRYFGFRPMIFNRELAELEAKESTEEFRKAFEKPDEKGLSDEAREVWLRRMEEHAVWVIERYTYGFSVSKCKPTQPQRPAPVTEAIH